MRLHPLFNLTHAIISICLFGSIVHAQVPELINYQGRVAVSGTNFTGTGQFKFALVDGGSFNIPVTWTASATATASNGSIKQVNIIDGGSGYVATPTVTINDSNGSGAQAVAAVSGGVVTGITVITSGSNYSDAPSVAIDAPPAATPVITFNTFWSNDGTSSGGSEPTGSVTLAVNKGIYSVLLGDSTQPNMNSLPAAVFTNSDVRLRVWFDDGVHGSQLLSPDQRIAAVGYAMMASSAQTVPDGSITSAKLASGVIGSSQLAAGAVSGAQSVTGTAQTATANTSYVVSGTGTATIILPTSANVGDVVQISGASAGWCVPVSYLNWSAVACSQPWVAVASSADGTRLVAAASIGQIYTSTDSGATWTARESSRYWTAVASSSDGTKLVAAASIGQIYTSTDSGVTWIARDSSRSWTAVASSADGSKLVAAVSGGQIYTSTDSGVTWTARATSLSWQAVASSADGSKLVAAAYNDLIYTSTDSGVTWTARATSHHWGGLASSSDGTKLVATEGTGGGAGGQIYTSTDSGVTWIARESIQEKAAVASSSDGSKLVAAVYYDRIYTSADSGVTWTAPACPQNCFAVASSSDGSKLVAAVNGGYIYLNGNCFRGAQGTTATFQYAGNGQWVRMVQAP